jgi:hypothetical protein
MNCLKVSPDNNSTVFGLFHSKNKSTH